MGNLGLMGTYGKIIKTLDDHNSASFKPFQKHRLLLGEAKIQQFTCLNCVLLKKQKNTQTLIAYRVGMARKQMIETSSKDHQTPSTLRFGFV